MPGSQKTWNVFQQPQYETFHHTFPSHDTPIDSHLNWFLLLISWHKTSKGPENECSRVISLLLITCWRKWGKQLHTARSTQHLDLNTVFFLSLRGPSGCQTYILLLAPPTGVFAETRAPDLDVSRISSGSAAGMKCCHRGKGAEQQPARSPISIHGGSAARWIAAVDFVSVLWTGSVTLSQHVSVASPRSFFLRCRSPNIAEDRGNLICWNIISQIYVSHLKEGMSWCLSEPVENDSSSSWRVFGFNGVYTCYHTYQTHLSECSTGSAS